MTPVVTQKKLRGLYAITDERLIPEQDFAQAIESALQGGARIMQYRDKSADHKKRQQQAALLCSLCEKYQAISIINDDIKLASAVNADGVHLGRNDSSITQARQILGNDAIIGVSCYNDIALARTAENNAASYVAFGAMFSSSTKPEAASASPSLIREAKKILDLPVCAIGGITTDNIQVLIAHGADMAAVINDLFSSADIKSAANLLSKQFN